MDNKDLFNAIDKAAEEYAADVWENTESESPIILRAENKPRSVKKIVLGTAACAAAAVMLGTAVTVGVKNNLLTDQIIPGSSGSSTIPGSSGSYAADYPDKNFNLSGEIFRIRDVGFYYGCEGISSEEREHFEFWYNKPIKISDGIVAVGPLGFIPETGISAPRPDVLFYNDTALDIRMLSDEAYKWLWYYCLMSEEDRAGETVPDEVKYLTEGGIARFGDVGFLRDKYTKEQLEYRKNFYAMYKFEIKDCVMPPMPDVYYFKDVPYNLDRINGDDAKRWLAWFCWLDDETQEALSGYVPEAMYGYTTGCNSKKPAEFVTYKGNTFDVRSVSYDTETFIKWYNSLSDDLKAKVTYEPEELFEDNIKKITGVKMPVELTGPDGIKLTSADMNDARNIFNSDGEEIGWDEVGVGSRIYFNFVYLAEPGSNEFKRYYVGDEICGLTITGADAGFEITGDETNPAMQYIWGRAFFDGEISVDAVVKKNNGEVGYSCVATGLPIVFVDNKAQKQGKLIPKPHDIAEVMPDSNGVPSDYFGGLNGESDRLFENQGKILHDVKLKKVAMFWSKGGDNRYDADLCCDAESSSAIAWKESGLRFPLDNVTKVLMYPTYATSEMLDYLGQGEFLTDYGCNVYSVDDGEVVEVCNDGYKYDQSYGKYVIIKHGEHKYAVYSRMCLEKDIPVKVGDKVTKGQVIGYAGTTGAVNRGVPGVGALNYHFYTDIPDY